MTVKVSAIVPAAGSGSRFDSFKNKLLEPIEKRSVLVNTLMKLNAISRITEIIVCTSEELIVEVKKQVKENALKKVTQIIQGGESRQDSVFEGLKVASNDIVLIHDGARPLIELQIIENSIDLAIEKGASIVAVPCKDTIKQAGITNKVACTLDRSALWAVQTPQVFKKGDLLNAYEKYGNEKVTDDSALVEKLGVNVFITEGSYKNIKITTKEDIELARILDNNTLI